MLVKLVHFLIKEPQRSIGGLIFFFEGEGEIMTLSTAIF